MNRENATTEHSEAWAAFVDNIGEEYATLDNFEEAYAGEWDSEDEYVEQLVDDLGILDGKDPTIARYFDYEAFTRDLFMSDYWSAPCTTNRAPWGVHIFHNI